MKMIVAAIAVLASAQSAIALSCIAPSVEFSYTQANDSEKAYVILEGRFDFDQRDLPQREVNNENPSDTLLDAQFTGSFFNGQTFDTPWSGPIQINAQCFGPWCSYAETGITGIAFVERTSEGYLMSLSPCGGTLFQNPTQAQRDAIIACHNGGACEADLGFN